MNQVVIAMSVDHPPLNSALTPWAALQELVDVWQHLTAYKKETHHIRIISGTEMTHVDPPPKQITNNVFAVAKTRKSFSTVGPSHQGSVEGRGQEGG